MLERTALHEKIRELAAIPDGEAHVIVLLADYVRDHPQDHRAAVAYADALRVVGREQDAARIFKAVLKRTRKSWWLATRIAMSMTRSDPEEAEHWYAEAARCEKN